MLLLKQQSLNSDPSEATKYGHYRETYDIKTDTINQIYFHCIPSDCEFEWMITHASKKAEVAEK